MNHDNAENKDVGIYVSLIICAAIFAIVHFGSGIIRDKIRSVQNTASVQSANKK